LRKTKQRANVPELDAILERKFQVLDQGFIRLVDYLGTEARIVQAARVSLGRGTTTPQRDAELIRYLWRNKHTSPFEQLQITLHCKLPIFVARQWVRHRTARLNELSGRYSKLPDEFYVPGLGRVQYQATENKQGSEGSLPKDEASQIVRVMNAGRVLTHSNYEGMVKRGVARELARIDLPLSTYTQWYWQIDLHNLLHFLMLRCSEHAQWEFRQYANTIRDEIVRRWVPTVWQAFEDFTLKALHFTQPEVGLLASVINARKLKKLVGQVENDSARKELAAQIGVSTTELKEVSDKLQRLLDT